ncbi:MAG TPA: hypothetical protein VFC99_18275 [Acidimicrobiia bacterium]|nr:hypothetical protein [Acidimicrobiia bacterium]
MSLRGRSRVRLARPGWFTVLVVALALVASACFAPGGPAVHRDLAGNPTSRDAFAWPFASSSPWNTPIGTGAQYSAPGDLRTQELVNTPAGINAAIWSTPVVQASMGDPVRTLFANDTVQLHVPASATPAGPPGGDATLAVVDPGRQLIDESWRTAWAYGNLVARFHRRVDLRGDGLQGVTAAGMSSIGGLIRTWEIQDHDIRHALQLAMPAGTLASGPVWPARAEDGFAASAYRGAVHMGSLVAIPPSVSIPSLGLSPEGTAIAYALQRYGAYVVNAAGQMNLYAEPSADPWLGSARADMRRIQAQLRVVTNNGPFSVGGGGTPLAPPAPPFYD